MSFLSGLGDFLFGSDAISVGPDFIGPMQPATSGLFDSGADLLSGAGALIGAFSGPDFVQQPTQGLGAADPRIQEFYLENYLPRVQAQLDAPFIGRPVRRAPIAGVDPEFDPIFGSYGLSDLQAYMDEMATGVNPANPQPVTQAPAATGQNTPAPVASEEARSALEQIGTPGFSEETNTYMTPFGQMIQGDAGRKAASDQALVNMAMDVASRGTNRAQGQQKAAAILDAIGSRGDTYNNPFLGQTYDRDALASALQAGDLYGAQQEANIGVYDPTPGFLGSISPLLKMLGTGAVLGPIAGSVVSGAGLSGLAGNIAQKGLTGLGQDLFNG